MPVLSTAPGALAPSGGPAAAASAPQATPFDLRIVVGLLGVLLAVLLSGFNENVTRIALTDIRGAMGIGYDEGTWLLALYAAGSVSAMAFAPWFAVTLSLRRFTLCAIAAFMLLGLLSPLAPDERVLMALRALQGLAAGALPPMLMTVALRFLPANIKLYGLAAFALTATFGPGMGTPLAAFWVEYVGWQWAFWQIIPGGLLAMAAVAWGLPQDPLRLERFAQFNWRGLLLGAPAISLLVIGLLQGERLNWLHSPLIVSLLGGGGLLLGLFLLNEWRHPLPYFKLQLLQVRNLSFALFTLAGVLLVMLASSLIPSSYLAQVQSYRPLQTAPMLLWVALPQLLALPLVAALCNLRQVDCRWVLAIGLGMMGSSCLLGSQLTSAWIRDDFLLIQLLQIFGQPMSVLPLLMLSTGSIAPVQGPFASAWFNTVKGLSAVVATAVLDLLTTARLHLHSTNLVDRLGNQPQLVDGAVTQLAKRVHRQALVLTSADLYLCVAMVAFALILIIPFVPTRIYPPRAAN
ncbi:MFS transporter [Stutzerimonas nitrititolerans]|uniref:MFS transporter n=1 Tax=Stutzerimonas nitrititolerans TaxID=2482751 RepID=UPI00289C9D56|nr:MFS transporter [Stutzerimonas nitrititolerans]